MKTAAIICEYNPFHNGHKYQIDTIKSTLGVDRIIALMSGDYVERGEPSLVSKETRTRIALEQGVDLVLLLPLPYATGSADLFSEGAITLLNKLGVVDYLCFGASTNDTNLLMQVSSKLSVNGTADSPEIQAKMKEGYTFAKARALLFPEYDAILNDSNNVLALAYLDALRNTNSTIIPHAIKRLGSSYSEESLPSDHTYASASAIRNALLKNQNVNAFLPYRMDEDKYIYKNDFSQMMFYALQKEKENLEEYLEVSHDLANKIRKNLPLYQSWEQFSELLKAKNLTLSRINRALLHIMLGLKGTVSEYKENSKKMEGIIVLGLNTKTQILKEIKSIKEIDPITKILDSYEFQNDYTKNMLDLELFASSLYNEVIEDHRSEYEKKFIVK